jgi:hypothetical protein
MFDGMGKRMSLPALAIASMTAFATPATVADEVPARTCTGLNCLPDQKKPADLCKGRDCNPPAPSEATQCDGLDCQPIPDQATPAPEREREKVGPEDSEPPAPDDDTPAAPQEKKVEPAPR